MSAWIEILCLVHADVSLEKAVKFKWFLEKYTSQGGTVPEGYTLRRVFATPTSSTQERLKIMLAEKESTIVADETTDSCQRNVLVALGNTQEQGKSYVIGVDFFTCINHRSL